MAALLVVILLTAVGRTIVGNLVGLTLGGWRKVVYDVSTMLCGAALWAVK